MTIRHQHLRRPPYRVLWAELTESAMKIRPVQNERQSAFHTHQHRLHTVRHGMAERVTSEEVPAPVKGAVGMPAVMILTPAFWY